MLKQQPKIRNIFVLLALTLGLVACQGSSSENNEPTPVSTPIPVAPQGTWTQYSASSLGSGNELGFINFMTAKNNQLAVAGTNTSLH